MNIRYFAVAVALIATAAKAAHGQDKPPVVARAEQCLKDNADRVVAAEPDLTSAANFLVTYRCAPEISVVERYQRNMAMVGLQVSMLQQFGPAANKGNSSWPSPPESVDPETGEVIVGPQPHGRRDQPSAVISKLRGEDTGQFMTEVVPFALRKLAGDLVLEARERQLAKGR